MNIRSLSKADPRITLSEAVDQFLLHQRSSRHSPRTIEGYEYVLGKLTSWAGPNGLSHLEDFTADHLRRYFAELQETVSPGTVATVHRRVKALFMFHEREENVAKNPMAKVKPPKLDREILPAFTPDEVRKMLDATTGRDPVSIRNRALITLLLDSGLRLREVTELKVGSVCAQTGIIHVKRGKGGKDRITKIGNEALKSFLKYSRIRAGIDGAPLWLGERGPMSEKGITAALKSVGAAAGVHAHPHKFRRTFAIMMLRAGCNVYSLQHLMGHSDASLSILRRYLDQVESDVTKDHERFSPLDHLR
jgi:site-specific recombinase XerD